MVLQRAAAETKTKGGLLIPEKAQAKQLEALVVAVGPGARADTGATIPMSVAVGDKVKYKDRPVCLVTVLAFETRAMIQY